MIVLVNFSRIIKSFNSKINRVLLNKYRVILNKSKLDRKT
jgi:hypothetical protein